MKLQSLALALGLVAASTQAQDLHAPFDTAAPASLFPRNDGLRNLAPIVNVDANALNSGRPIPTNKWWGNLIHSNAGDGGNNPQPAWANPYTLKLPVTAPFGIQSCYSYSYRVVAGVNNGRAKYYFHEFHNDLTLSAVEFTSRPSYTFDDWSDMGALVHACLGGRCLHSALVSGMGFVTARYEGLRPRLESEFTVTGLSNPSANKWVIQLSNSQTWVMYAPSGGISFSAQGKAVVASGGYTGRIRVAVLPQGAAHSLYDAYADCTVLRGDVVAESRTSYAFNWEVDGPSCSRGGLLHYALPHIYDTINDKREAPGLRLHSTTRGEMTPIVAVANGNRATWRMTEPESPVNIGFYPPRAIDPSLVNSLNLVATLRNDINANWVVDGGSYYFSGKAYQKYASLCLMADDPAIMGSDKSLKNQCVQKLEKTIERFLTNSYGAPLAYDTVYRGIVSSVVFQTGDINADFGNGMYNDHHYHYGYWIAASAMLKKLDPNWSRMGELNRMITTLLRDEVNPSDADKYFPRFRQFSWFRGHSYSHGASLLADGKDEESSSEEINAHYGLMLWGQVSGNRAMENLGSLMLRINARAIQKYFLVDRSNAIHPPAFAKNRVTGIFFDNKADYATWFSAAIYCIHGIQMIPVSPINEIVRTATFVRQEWEDILSKEQTVISRDLGNAWNSLLFSNYAVVDKSTSLNVLRNVALDDGLTRSWALYIAATRPGSGTVPTQPPSPTQTPAPTRTPSPTSPPVTPSPGSCVLEANVDYAGNDVGSKLSPDPNGCCQFCRNHVGCRAFSWSDYAGGMCWLKGAKGAVVPMPGMYAGVI